jgi:hypothetical protein
MHTNSRSGAGGAPTPRHAVLVTGLFLAAGMLAATTSPLHAQTYPEEGSNVFDEDDFVSTHQDALTEATVHPRTRPERVVAHERAEVTVTLVIGIEPGGPDVPQVEVAWENEAVLRPQEEGAFEVFPSQPVVKTLGQCLPRADGGCGLDWKWTIIPRQEGPQVLLLTVSPLVYVGGQLSEKFKQRNADIEIDVLVHPAVSDFRIAREAIREMDVTAPSRIAAGGRSTVTATFPKSWRDDNTVMADIRLERGPGSAPVRIVEERTDASAGSVTRTWVVEPAESGVVSLVFTAQVSAQAGDRSLEEAWPQSLDIEVQASFWDRIRAPAVWLGAFVTLAAGILGLLAAWRRRHAGAGA